jgi:hypothetical protein
MAPLRDKLRVSLLPTPQASKLIIAPDQDTMVRWATVQAVGPDTNERFAPEDAVKVGQEVLVNLLSAQQFGDDYIVPVGALLATRS